MSHLNSRHIFACYYTVVPWHQRGFLFSFLFQIFNIIFLNNFSEKK